MPHLTRRSALGLLGATVVLPRLLTSRADAALSFQPVGQPFRVDKAEPLSGGNFRPVLVNRNDGGFIAAWANSLSNGKYDSQSYVAFFAPTAGSFRPVTQLGVDCGGGGPGCGNTAGANAWEGAPVAFPDGTSLVFFSADRVSTDDEHAPDVFVQRFAANRQPIGVPADVNQTRIQYQNSPLATRLSNNNALVTFVSYRRPHRNNFDIKGRVYNASGVALTAEKVVTVDTTATQAVQDPGSLAPLLNGRSLLSYLTRVSGQNEYYVQVLDSAANRIGAPLLIKQNKGGSFGHVFLMRLQGGRCLALWSEHISLGDTLLRGRFFAGDGTPGPVFDIGPSRVSPYGSGPTAAVDSNGRIVCMTDERENSSDRFAAVWILSPAGQRLVGPVKLGAPFVGITSQAANIIYLPSKEYVVGSGSGLLQRFRLAG
jgi:hypothetical protein